MVSGPPLTTHHSPLTNPRSPTSVSPNVSAEVRLTRLGDVLGTPSYMAPEQARGKDEVGVSADVYSLGAILYEMLTGRPPFREDTALATLLLVDSAEPTAPTALRAGLAPDLEAICLRCLRKNPAERYATAAALADDLARFLAVRPVAARPVGVGTRVVKWTRRAPAQAALIVGSILGGVLLLAAILFHGELMRQERDRAVAGQREAAELCRGRDAARRSPRGDANDGGPAR